MIDRQPNFQCWRTTDGQEIERRRWRGRTEVVAVEALEPDREFFGSFRIRAASGNDYTVEIRSLDGLENSRDCLDYRVNGLGTCKHIEGTLGALRRGRARAFAKAARRGSPRLEIYLSRHGDPVVRTGWPVGDGAFRPNSAAGVAAWDVRFRPRLRACVLAPRRDGAANRHAALTATNLSRRVVNNGLTMQLSADCAATLTPPSHRPPS